MSDTITIGRCKDCAWRDKGGCCTNDDKIREQDYDKRSSSDDHLIYCYHESGSFWVGPEFGCVHWKEANNKLHSAAARRGPSVECKRMLGSAQED